MTIKDLRTASGMNIKQFSEYFSIPYRTIQHWEQSTRECLPYLIELMEYKLRKEGLLTNPTEE